MKQTTVKSLMVPLEEYATVSSKATLQEALRELEKAQAAFEQGSQSKYVHRALLVYDADHGEIIGKISQLDVLKSLDPQYSDITTSGPLGRIATSGLSANYLQSMLERQALLSQSLEDLCRKAARLKVKDCMYIPAEGEFIEESDTLRMAVHQLVMGHHHSLLVLDDDNKISGILRLVDVFQLICTTIENM